jgi:hypothetical protein
LTLPDEHPDLAAFMTSATDEIALLIYATQPDWRFTTFHMPKINT